MTPTKNSVSLDSVLKDKYPARMEARNTIPLNPWQFLRTNLDRAAVTSDYLNSLVLERLKLKNDEEQEFIKQFRDLDIEDEPLNKRLIVYLIANLQDQPLALLFLRIFQQEVTDASMYNTLFRQSSNPSQQLISFYQSQNLTPIFGSILERLSKKHYKEKQIPHAALKVLRRCEKKLAVWPLKTELKSFYLSLYGSVEDKFPGKGSLIVTQIIFLRFINTGIVIHANQKALGKEIQRIVNDEEHPNQHLQEIVSYIINPASRVRSSTKEGGSRPQSVEQLARDASLPPLEGQ